MSAYLHNASAAEAEVARLQKQLQDVSQNWSDRMRQVAQAVEASKAEMEAEWRNELEKKEHLEKTVAEATLRATTAERELTHLRDDLDRLKAELVEERRHKSDALVALEVLFFVNSTTHFLCLFCPPLVSSDERR